jgi:hypothetical protein
MLLTRSPALPGQGTLVILATATLQQTTQQQGMLRVRQPEDGVPVQLVDTLAADIQSCTDGGEGLRGTAVEAVVGDDDVTQARGELSGQVVQEGVDLRAVESLGLVGLGG